MYSVFDCPCEVCRKIRATLEGRGELPEPTSCEQPPLPLPAPAPTGAPPLPGSADGDYVGRTQDQECDPEIDY